MEETRNAYGKALAKLIKNNKNVVVLDADLTKSTKTIKGKGVSFLEGNYGWHGKAPRDEEYAIAMEDLKEAK